MRFRLLAVLLVLANWLTACEITPRSSPHYFKGKDAALEKAIEADSPEAIGKAVTAGANINARSAQGRTPIMLAVDYRKRQALAELLSRRADPNAVAMDGNSAVSLAVENYRSAPDIFFAIMRGGGNPDIREPDEDPVIMRFVTDRNCEFIRHMKSFGANLDALTRNERPIIGAAGVRLDWDVVWCLMELGAKYDYENDSRNALSLALKLTFPSPDSPIYIYKKKVWEFLKSKGIAVSPLNE